MEPSSVPAHLPIQFTTAIFLASTGGSQHVASSPVHEDQTIDHIAVSGLVRKLEKEFHVSLCVISLVSMWRRPTQNYQLDRWDMQAWKDLGIVYKNRCYKMTPK